jgi:hypothetical protein
MDKRKKRKNSELSPDDGKKMLSKGDRDGHTFSPDMNNVAAEKVAFGDLPNVIPLGTTEEEERSRNMNCKEKTGK